MSPVLGGYLSIDTHSRHYPAVRWDGGQRGRTGHEGGYDTMIHAKSERHAGIFHLGCQALFVLSVETEKFGPDQVIPARFA
jgi:hypothetical protein